MAFKGGITVSLGTAGGMEAIMGLTLIFLGNSGPYKAQTPRKVGLFGPKFRVSSYQANKHKVFIEPPNHAQRYRS